jgi:uncharacterized membrane protein|tara:strand:+ start:93 stop:1376 length:1284 start_codon:yes stop_codon:yes gene_type:complete
MINTGGFKMRKLLSALTMMLVMLFSINLVAAAADFDISKVEVDDITITESGDAVHVEADSTVEVEVYVQGNGSSDDVKVRAWIGGYEYGSIEDRTEIFEVENNVDYRKTLTLRIPKDIDASDDYTLHVEIFDDDNSVDKDFTLRVQEKRHFLDIQDVILRPSSQIEAGRVLFTTVRVENLGDKKEEDIKISVAIPELGVSSRDYIDELVPVENTDDDDEETSASSNEIFLRVPKDARTGDYEVLVEVSYNRGHDVVRAKTLVHVEGVSVAGLDDTIISVDSQSKSVDAGEQTGYRIMVANMGEEVQRYSLEVSGENLWATSRVDPLFVTVRPGETGELNALLTVKEDAPQGRNSFVAKVRSGDQLVKEISLTADVNDGSLSFGDGTRKALTVVFGVLVVLLIILGLVVAFNKMKGDEGEGEEGTNYY